MLGLQAGFGRINNNAIGRLALYCCRAFYVEVEALQE